MIHDASLSVLIVGGGGREHALAKACCGSPKLKTLYAVPGNDGMGEICTLLPNDVETADHVKALGIDLVIFGPEQPLVDGEADTCSALCRVVGPNQAAAALEGSKAFMKEVAAAAGVPSAAFKTFQADQMAQAIDYVKEQGAPIVVKASGLAAGKGVVVADTVEQAVDAVQASLSGDAFGAAGHEVVIEECLVGPEISIFHLVRDGKITFLGAAQDHKRQLDGDKGPNTGGMGTFSPSPLWHDDLRSEVETQIVTPTLGELSRRGAAFEGFLFTGIMLTAQGPKLLEFNVRMGDPETQSLMPLLQCDLLSVLMGEDQSNDISPADRHAVTVVLAAPGYPMAPEKGLAMPAIPQDTDTVRFTVAGAKKASDGSGWISTGGRVLGVTGLGESHQEARNHAYAAIEQYGWQQAQYRTDIGKKE